MRRTALLAGCSVRTESCGAEDLGAESTRAMKWVLIFTAVGEAGTGLALLIVPALVGCGCRRVRTDGIAIPVAARPASPDRLGGSPCWPGPPRLVRDLTARPSRFISPTSASQAV